MCHRSDSASDFKKSDVSFYEQQKSYITVFLNGDSYKVNNRNTKNTSARCVSSKDISDDTRTTSLTIIWYLYC